MTILNRTSTKAVSVTENAVYEHNDTKNRVVAFHVEAGRVVRFANESGATGREYRLPLDEFLDQYTMVPPKEQAKEAQATDEARLK